MAEPVGALRVDLASNVAQFQSDMGKVRQITNTTAVAMQRSMMNFTKGAQAAAKEVFNLRNAAVLLGGAAMVALIKRSVAYGASLDDQSQRLGMNVEKFQELAYAASLAGVSQEDFGKALEQFNKRLGEVKAGVTGAEQSLGKLGLTMADIRGKSPDEAFRLVADRISRIKDPMQQAAVAAELFGKSGVKLLPVLKDGAAGLSAMADEARRLGFILSKETIAKAAEADDEFERIGKALKVAGVNISAGFLPALTAIREVMTSQEFQDGIKKFGERLGEAVTWMVNNKDTIIKVAGAMTGMMIGARMFGLPGALAGGAAGAVAAGEMLAGDGGEPTRITVTPNKKGPDIDPAAGDAARRMAETLQDLQFKTQLARGEFRLLAEGFPELAHGMKLFGEKGVEGRVAVELLNPQLQKLNEAMLLLKGAQLTQENLAPWDAYEQKLARINELLAKQIISADTATRAQRKLAVESGTAWDVAGASIAGSIHDAASAFGDESAKMARIAQIAGGIQAVISMWTGAAKALELPFPANLAAWATVLATGAKAVAAIKSQKIPAFQTGGAIRMNGMFSGADSQLFQAKVEPREQIDIWRPGEGPDPRRGAGGGGTFNIFVDPVSRPFAEALIPALNDAMGDGFQLNVKPR